MPENPIQTCRPLQVLGTILLILGVLSTPCFAESPSDFEFLSGDLFPEDSWQEVVEISDEARWSEREASGPTLFRFPSMGEGALVRWSTEGLVTVYVRTDGADLWRLQDTEGEIVARGLTEVAFLAGEGGASVAAGYGVVMDDCNVTKWYSGSSEANVAGVYSSYQGAEDAAIAKAKREIENFAFNETLSFVCPKRCQYPLSTPVWREIMDVSSTYLWIFSSPGQNWYHASADYKYRFGITCL